MSHSLHEGFNYRTPKLEGCATEGRKRALVLDDMEPNRKAITAFLFFLKYDVDLAMDGLEAKRCTKKPYDIAFSDIEMPTMNGSSCSRGCADHRLGSPHR